MGDGVAGGVLDRADGAVGEVRIAVAGPAAVRSVEDFHVGRPGSPGESQAAGVRCHRRLGSQQHVGVIGNAMAAAIGVAHGVDALLLQESPQVTSGLGRRLAGGRLQQGLLLAQRADQALRRGAHPVTGGEQLGEGVLRQQRHRVGVDRRPPESVAQRLAGRLRPPAVGLGELVGQPRPRLLVDLVEALVDGSLQFTQPGAAGELGGVVRYGLLLGVDGVTDEAVGVTQPGAEGLDLLRGGHRPPACQRRRPILRSLRRRRRRTQRPGTCSCGRDFPVPGRSA